MNERKKTEAIVTIGRDGEPCEVSFDVNEPTIAEKRVIASYQYADHTATGAEAGAASAALVEKAFEILGIMDDQIEGLTPIEVVIAGKRLAFWITERDSKNS
jgi:hypothetical protein